MTPKRSHQPGRTRTIGPYDLVAELSRNELGAMWAARVVGQQENPIVMVRQVSIRGATPQDLAHLAEAARGAKRLNHQSIIPILDVVRTEGELAIVSSYQPGETMRTLLRQASVQRLAGRAGAPIPAPVALFLALDMLDGLAFLERHTAHRSDLTCPVWGGLGPDAVLLGADGRARLLEPTVSAAALGCPYLNRHPRRAAYIAPEVWNRQHEVGVQADLFTLGVLLWEMLLNRPLFSGSSREAIAQQVCHGPIARADRVRPGGDAVNSNLADVIERALQRDPRARFPSAVAMADAIWEAGHSIAKTRRVVLALRELTGDAISRQQQRLAEAVAAAEQRDPTEPAEAHPARPRRVPYAQRRRQAVLRQPQRRPSTRPSERRRPGARVRDPASSSRAPTLPSSRRPSTLPSSRHGPLLRRSLEQRPRRQGGEVDELAYSGPLPGDPTPPTSGSTLPSAGSPPKRGPSDSSPGLGLWELPDEELRSDRPEVVVARVRPRLQALPPTSMFAPDRATIVPPSSPPGATVQAPLEPPVRALSRRSRAEERPERTRVPDHAPQARNACGRRGALARRPATSAASGGGGRPHSQATRRAVLPVGGGERLPPGEVVTSDLDDADEHCPTEPIARLDQRLCEQPSPRPSVTARQPSGTLRPTTSNVAPAELPQPTPRLQDLVARCWRYSKLGTLCCLLLLVLLGTGVGAGLLTNRARDTAMADVDPDAVRTGVQPEGLVGAEPGCIDGDPQTPCGSEPPSAADKARPRPQLKDEAPAPTPSAEQRESTPPAPQRPRRRPPPRYLPNDI